MKRKFLMIAAFFMVLMICLVPQKANAAGSSTSTTTVASKTIKKLGWVKENGKWHYYRLGGKLAKGWVAYKGKWYYTDKVTGDRLTGWQTISGVKHYFRKAGAYLIRSGLWKIDGKYYYFQSGKNRLTDGVPATGWKTVNGKDYYFKEDGSALSGFQTLDGYTYYFRAKIYYKATGWLTINKKRYHFNTSDSSRPIGDMDKGLVTISGSQYFFGEDGVQITDDFDANGKHYSFDANGRCTLTDLATMEEPGISQSGTTTTGTNGGLSDDFLFFTIYESGRNPNFYDGYNQTGGDNGNACGKYQFDYRYALLPFVKYCYSKDPVFFKEFKSYANLSLLQKSKLKGNTKFYAAWNAIFKKDKVKFANYQDAYAKQEYYDMTERYLKNFGVDISKRPDVVKGAVFSYSIQHGQLTAANAVVAAKITNKTSDKSFLTKLYNYRIEKFPAYISRYTSEKTEALSLLKKAA